MTRIASVIAAAGIFIILAPGSAAPVECDELGHDACQGQSVCVHPEGTAHCYWRLWTGCNCEPDLPNIDIPDACADPWELWDPPDPDPRAFDFDYSTGTLLNDYTLPAGNSCTGYTANGPDGVLYVNLQAGGIIDVHMQPTDNPGYDASLYLLTDCDDPAGTCVAGADDTVGGGEETFSYVAPVAGIYFIIFDAWTSSPAPTTIHIWGTVDGSVVTPVERVSWGTIKAMYR